MSPELEDQLVRKYPELFVGRNKPLTESLMAFGCECGDGWFVLLDQMCACIAQHVATSPPERSYQFVQIKEKYGGLRVYDLGHDDTIFGIISLAEAMSYRICELCGQAAHLTAAGFWVRTLCPACAEKNGYVPVDSDPNKDM